MKGERAILLVWATLATMLWGAHATAQDRVLFDLSRPIPAAVRSAVCTKGVQASSTLEKDIEAQEQMSLFVAGACSETPLRVGVGLLAPNVTVAATTRQIVATVSAAPAWLTQRSPTLILLSRASNSSAPSVVYKGELAQVGAVWTATLGSTLPDPAATTALVVSGDIADDVTSIKVGNVASLSLLQKGGPVRVLVQPDGPDPVYVQEPDLSYSLGPLQGALDVSTITCGDTLVLTCWDPTLSAVSMKQSSEDQAVVRARLKAGYEWVAGTDTTSSAQRITTLRRYRPETIPIVPLGAREFSVKMTFKPETVCQYLASGTANLECGNQKLPLGIKPLESEEASSCSVQLGSLQGNTIPETCPNARFVFNAAGGDKPVMVVSAATVPRPEQIQAPSPCYRSVSPKNCSPGAQEGADGTRVEVLPPSAWPTGGATEAIGNVRYVHGGSQGTWVGLGRIQIQDFATLPSISATVLCRDKVVADHAVVNTYEVGDCRLEFEAPSEAKGAPVRACVYLQINRLPPGPVAWDLTGPNSRKVSLRSLFERAGTDWRDVDPGDDVRIRLAASTASGDCPTSAQALPVVAELDVVGGVPFFRWVDFSLSAGAGYAFRREAEQSALHTSPFVDLSLRLLFVPGRLGEWDYPLGVGFHTGVAALGSLRSQAEREQEQQGSTDEVSNPESGVSWDAFAGALLRVPLASGSGVAADVSYNRGISGASSEIWWLGLHLTYGLEIQEVVKKAATSQ